MKPERWREVALGDVAAEVTVGYVGRMTSEYVDAGVPFLRSLNVREHRIDLADIRYVSADFDSKLNKSRLRPGDVVTVRTGKPGATAVIPKDLPAANCSDLVITRPGQDLDPRWLSYYFNGAAEGFIASRLVGAVQQHFNVGAAKQMTLLLPPIEEQRAIGEVLGALDDQIAANRRVVARGLQFVDGLYAGTAKVRRGDTFSTVARLGGGGTPSTKDTSLWGDDHGWATPTDVTGLDGPWLLGTGRRISDRGLARISSKLYPRRTVLMTSRASIGHCAIAAAPVAVNQGFVCLQAHDTTLQSWLFAQVRSRTAEFVSWANGATFLELPKGIFKSLPVDLPTARDLQTFAQTVDPLLDRIECAQRGNQRLASTRDELLPLLMGGRVTVKDAERRVGEEI